MVSTVAEGIVGRKMSMGAEMSALAPLDPLTQAGTQNRKAGR